MKPLKVMIVDDEVLAIEHLRHMISWEDHGFTIVGEAFSANKAIEIVKATRPHIIFMDIQMPRMDGLQLSQKILEYRSTTKIVLLTSHRDFDYAKKAMNLGISTYLLKHELQEAKLTETLEGIKTELQEQEEKVLSIKRQCLLDLLVFGRHKETAMKNLKRNISDINSSFVFYFVKVDTAFSIFDHFSSAADLYVPELEWKGIIQTDEMEYIESIAFEGGKVLILCKLKHRLAEKEGFTTIYNQALTIKNEGKQIGLSLSTIISPIFRKMEDLPFLYREIEKKSISLILYENQTIVRSQDIPPLENDILEEWKGTIPFIRKQATSSEGGDFIEAVHVVFRRMREKFHPSVLQVVCKEFIYLLDQLREKYQIPTYFELGAQNQAQIPDFYTLEDISQWLIEEYKNISTTQRHSGFSKKIQLIMNYIHDHYQKDLSIEMIGESLSISGDHLRHLFKKETGRTILDYLTWFRIERAKKLLEGEEYKVYEVAEMVGYKTSQYFSMVFKKWTGFTPIEYKDQRK
jgi:two-component system, response regulator YesN